ncbi:MAG: ATP-dependent endonuclease [Ignavibacteriae bacterium]|nr:ATP-dependent endonuclease [Ignavibacteriota bacterium]
MILRQLKILNFRSIRDSGEIPVASLFALIGENNSGKSNIIRAIECLTSAGASGISKDDFNDPTQPIIIKGTFGVLLPREMKRWKSYLVGNDLILEKHFGLEVEDPTTREKVTTEFHGYRAEPKEWFLSIPQIEARSGNRVNWKDIVENNGLPEYFFQEGRCTKAIFQKALSRYLLESEVEYNEPDLSSAQALGLQSNVVATLPRVYLLEAITDYSEEIDRRSSSTTFRRLMGDLSERILKKDPKYQQVQAALDSIKALLNKPVEGEREARLQSLETVEKKITEVLRTLMPSVQRVSMSIAIDEMKDIFSSGVSLTVNDGVETDVLLKGHGLQRCIVFTLLQTLIMNERNQLVEGSETNGEEPQCIILGIEEPELYIHPQLSKLFYDVMRQFAKTDQVIYSTHSPLFIDAFEYDKLAIVKKPSADVGTKVRTYDSTALEGLPERKVFQGLTKLNPAINEMFFARRVLLVEGPEDGIAITATLQDEKMIVNRVEELEWSIVVTGGKPAIPFFQRVLNSFEIPYAVLHDHDITPEMEEDAKEIHEKANKAISDLAGGNPVYKFPIKLETSLGLTNHFKDQYAAHKRFEDPTNITSEVREIIKSIFVPRT